MPDGAKGALRGFSVNCMTSRARSIEQGLGHCQSGPEKARSSAWRRLRANGNLGRPAWGSNGSSAWSALRRGRIALEAALKSHWNCQARDYPALFCGGCSGECQEIAEIMDSQELVPKWMPGVRESEEATEGQDTVDGE